MALTASAPDTSRPPCLPILLIDDDTELCQLLSKYLEQAGYKVESVHTGGAGVARALSGGPSIVVLDLMLPDIGGLEVLRQVRVESTIPILVLTARGDEQDRIVGLERGADDYLTKPFNPRELCARLDAILRRCHANATVTASTEADRVVVNDLELDRSTRIVRRRGEPIGVTTVEFDLLDLLLRSAGHVVSREQLVRTVLGRELAPFDRGIDNHVSNLRKKLGQTSDGLERIRSVRGIGYQYSKHRRT